MKVSGLEIEVVRKDIKNLHLGVYPPEGRVRVAAPFEISDESIRLKVISKLAWIRKHQRALAGQARQSEREYVSGESHALFGRNYILKVVYRFGRHQAEISGKKLVLFVNPGTKIENRAKVIERFHREKLNREILRLLPKWEEKLDVKVRLFRIRKMRTKWGSCNIDRRTILLNLELAKKPLECLEYIIVHELVHFDHRNHSELFMKRMGSVMPGWNAIRKRLNEAPLPRY